jgi:phosphohistidine phosphatase
MVAKTLFLLRHAKAVPAETAEDDAERALAPRGRRQARALAGWFRAKEIAPERVLVSPAARTRETLDLVRTGFAGQPDLAVEFDSRLYLASWPAILERIRQVSEETNSLMVVGHNPGIHELAVSLAVMAPRRVRQSLNAKFPTGALATFAIGRGWREFNRASIDLVECLTPADLDASAGDDE